MTMWFTKGRYRKSGSYILDFVLEEGSESEKIEVEMFCFDMLLINKFYIKKYIGYILVK